MYCPKCGASEQLTETFCRNCGIFLPDLDNLKRSEQPPEMHIKSNALLSIFTIAATLTIAALLYAAFYGQEIPILIYPAAGLLFAISSWQIQLFWRTMLLRRQIKKNLPRYAEKAAKRSDGELAAAATGNLLEEADFEDYVPASVTDRTTRHLIRDRKRSS